MKDRGVGENKSNEKKTKNDRLIGADGLRAIACLMIIFTHLWGNLNIQSQTGGVREAEIFFIMVANTGTSIFFILSGFLLAYPFWKKYLNNESFPNIKNYVIRRAARIVPGFYIALAASVIVMLAFKMNVQYLWQRVLAAATFTSGFHYITFFPTDINGPLWSISFEVFCYLLMPIFMSILYKFSKNRSFKKAILYWCGVFILILVMNQLVQICFATDDVNKGWQFGIIGGAKSWMPNYNPVGFFAQFSIGIMAAGITTQLFSINDKLKHLKEMWIFDIISAISLVSAFILIWNLRYAPEFSHSIQNQPYFFPYFQVLIAITLITATHSNIFGKILDNKFFKYTAKVSFGLYIWHYLVMNVVYLKFFNGMQYMAINDIGTWLLISLSIIGISYLIATISYKFVEKPILDKAHSRKG